MKSFFDPAARTELQTRLEALRPDSAARWGTMDPARMLAHCVEGMKMGTGELKVKAGVPALFGWMFKRLAYDDRRWRHGTPTATELKVSGDREFAAEKAHLLERFGQLAAGPAAIGAKRHPFFGSLTGDQWGMLLYKHLDHHFRQFGV